MTWAERVGKWPKTERGYMALVERNDLTIVGKWLRIQRGKLLNTKRIWLKREEGKMTWNRRK